MCRICGEGRDTIEHMLHDCKGSKEREESVTEILNEDGRGVESMKEVEKTRSQSVTDTLVATDWYLGDISLQKDILFMLQRSQKYMCVYVGSFGILSYEFFLGVIKMSYSILAMLKS
ncbi:hypothetical protein Zmor_026903 [Zophobas morio]|uniref:Uncharacterized protein n=1 Tax=Zophobas morio TaxID=2755281 RepID=A0AA38HUM3_9CUCU|nr:hypothetical protein Zmor_026903 [Zophobas morio]